jgi:2-keto-3-deoxy-6-phosphogluconate aldolase
MSPDAPAVNGTVVPIVACIQVSRARLISNALFAAGVAAVELAHFALK